MCSIQSVVVCRTLQKEWEGEINDAKVPGLQSLIDVFNVYYRRISDESIINNDNTIINKRARLYKDETFNYRKRQHITQQNYREHSCDRETFNYHKNHFTTRNLFQDHPYEHCAFNYRKNIEDRHVALQHIPNCMNQDFDYIYVKQHNQQLFITMRNLQSHIDDLQNPTHV
jgi:hypothetical protein